MFCESTTSTTSALPDEGRALVDLSVTQAGRAGGVLTWLHIDFDNGIELDNIGRYPNWLDSRHQAMHEAYEFTQLNSLATLVTQLAGSVPTLRWVAGHEDLDTEKVTASDNPELEVFRKRDPGALFPWQEFLATIPLERFQP